MPTPHHVVITGAPAAGKTELLGRLAEHPAFAGYLFFEELARALLAEDPTWRTRRRDFHREIYRRQTAREGAAAGQPFVTDRGTVDAFAFHPETLHDVGTTLENEYRRYDLVLHLGSSANLGDDFYTVDAVRTESRQDALQIERALTVVWREHPAYRFIPAETKKEQKFAAVLALLGQSPVQPNRADVRIPGRGNS